MDSTDARPWVANEINAPSGSFNTASREYFKIISAKGRTAPTLCQPTLPNPQQYGYCWDYNQDPFSQATMDSLTDNSTPNTKSWAGVPSGMPIKNIHRNTSNNYVTFTVGNLLPSLPPIRKDTVADDICEGESFTFRGQNYTTTGIFYDTVKMPVGQADTIYTLNLLVWETVRTNLSESICQGDSVFFKNMWLKTAGIYRDTLAQSYGLGCDSIVELDLTVLPKSSYEYRDTIFQGDSLNFFGTFLKTAGTFQHKLVNSVGCDSTITLNLAVKSRDVSNVPIALSSDSEVIKIVPNPVRAGQEFIVIIDEKYQNNVVEIYCLSGSLISSVSTPLNDRNAEIKIPGIKNPGTYILRAGRMSAKIVVIP
jgi:hypothetical protein